MTGLRLSFALLCLATAALAEPPVARWRAETPAMPGGQAGDLALLFERSYDGGLLIAADKNSQGLFVYDLTGSQVDTIDTNDVLGGVTGLDSRSALSTPAGGSLLLGTSAANTVLFGFGARSDAGLDAGLVQVFSQPVPSPENLAMTLVADGGLEVWVDTADQLVRHYSVGVDGGFRLLESANVGALFPSGLVVDDRSGRLVLAMGAQGVWVREPDAGFFQLLSVSDGGFPLGVLTVGGVALYPLHDGGSLLLTTAPGTGELVVHDLAKLAAPKLLGSARIGAPDGGPFRVSLPAWVDVSQYPVAGYASGVLVLHDGASQNYKLVGWEDLAAAFAPPLPIELRSLLDPSTDAGLADGGSDGGTDAGPSDDAGRPDAGPTDGGPTDAGPGGGSGGSISGSHGGGGDDDVGRLGCGCSGPAAPLALLGLFAWFLRRQRRS